MDLAVDICMMSHLSDVQAHAIDEYSNRRLNFVKFLIQKYGSKQRIDPDAEYQEFITKFPMNKMEEAKKLKALTQLLEKYSGKKVVLKEDEVRPIKQKPAKTFIVKKVDGGRNDRTRYVVGTLQGLIDYFSYTLEIGNSWNRKINRNPTNIKSFIKNLQASYAEKEANLYNRTFVDLVDSIPPGEEGNISKAGSLNESEEYIEPDVENCMKALVNTMLNILKWYDKPFESFSPRFCAALGIADNPTWLRSAYLDYVSRGNADLIKYAKQLANFRKQNNITTPLNIEVEKFDRQ